MFGKVSSQPFSSFIRLFLFAFLLLAGWVNAQPGGGPGGGNPPGFNSVADDVELQVLKDLYDNLGGANWTNKTNWPTPGNWPAVATAAEFGTWYGVTVSNGDILSIMLGSNNLVGTIPASISSLSYLNNLSLHKNSISGTIPSFTNPSNLTFLFLYENQLTGSIPLSLGGLTKLSLIGLNDNKLSGAIPSTLGNATHLTNITLSRNQLSGIIPSELGNLPSLQVLFLDGNQLTGAIPTTLCNLSTLQQLYLHSNQLTGAIPSSIGNLAQLKFLNLSSNQLSGSIPGSITSCTQLQTINLSINQLTGAIPDSFGNMTALTTVQFQANNLTGALPSTLGSCSNLTMIYLTENALTGGIPGSYINLAKLNYLYLNSNSLSGTSVADLINQVNKSNLSVTLNNNLLDFSQMEPLVGAGFKGIGQLTQKTINDITALNQPIGVPMVITARPTGQFSTVTWEKQNANATWSTISNDQDAQQQTYTRTAAAPTDAGVYRWKMTNTKVTGVTLYSDPITVTVNVEGAVPDALEFQALKNIYDSLGGSGWTNKTNWPTTGNWPASATAAQMATWFGVTVTNGDITKIILPNNNLIGSIPVTIGNLRLVDDLSLQYNLGIQGTIPSTIASIAALKNLVMYKCNLSGALPQALFNLPSISMIALYENKLTGTLPTSIGNAISLTSLALSNNKLSGEIPTSIGNLTELLALELSNNLFSGTIPTQLGNLTKLNRLFLTANPLNGVIPSSLGNLTELLNLDLSSDNLSGSIPGEVGNLVKIQQLKLYNNKLTGNIPAEIGNLTNLIYLNLANNQLTSSIPASICNLTKLTQLQLSSNQITGTLPSCLGNFTQLNSIYLDNNLFTGSIPSSYGSLSNLKLLYLNNNQLTGPLPIELNSLNQLEDLRLYVNQFSGIVPTFSSSVSLTTLNLGGNDFVSIPDFSIHPNKTNLTLSIQNNRLDFSRLEPQVGGGIKSVSSLIQKTINDITAITKPIGTPLVITARPTGQFSTVTWEKQNADATWSTISNDQDVQPQTYTRTAAALADAGVYRWKMTNTKVTGVTLYSDPITVTVNVEGAVPDAAELQALKNIYDSLGGSGWTNKTNWPTAGNWPASATAAQMGTWYGVTVTNGDVSTFLVPNNNLTGQIPSSISQLSSLTYINFQNNKIGGSLSSSVAQLSKLTILNVRQNQLTGSIPGTLNNLINLSQLSLGMNKFTGDIPDLGSLTALTILDFSVNPTLAPGPIPSWIQNLTLLSNLGMTTTQRSGTIPSFIWNLTNLTTLYLDINGLTGQIPPQVANLTNLNTLWLNYNQLSGNIPTEIGSLTKLTGLGMYANKLTGDIPSSLGNLSNLQNLLLYGNSLTGPIPDSFSNLTKLVNLDLSANTLTGPIPSWIGNLSNLVTLNLNTCHLSGAIPSTLGNLTKLGNLFIQNNQFTGAVPSSILNLPLVMGSLNDNDFSSIPNFSNQTNKANLTLSVQNNHLDFSQLEPLVGGGIKTVTVPLTQKTINDITAITKSIGTSLVITARPTGQFSAVTWEKQNADATWSTISNDQDAQPQTYTRTAAALTDAGVYRWKMTNTKVTGVTLYSDPITVTVNEGTIADAIEFQALKNIYDSLGGSGWTNKTNWPIPGNWPASATAAQMATWNGITVSNGDITSVALITNNLVGQIPSTISNLQSLTSINFQNNKITGQLPKSVSLLTKLTYLNIRTNQISGSIPGEINNLVNLTQLNLGPNSFTGDIPYLGGLTNLTTLEISVVQVNPGPIPSWIQNLTKLTSLNLTNSRRNGTIPSFIWNLTNLTILYLDTNGLTGSIPPEIGNLTNLAYFTAITNQLTGSIPAEIGSLNKLITLQLTTNQLSGSIPSSIGNLVNLQYLVLASNQFTGPIPASLESLSHLITLDLTSNKLSGTIPSWLGNLTNLTSLLLGSNSLTGTIPSSLGNIPKLRSLALYNNQLTGELPTSLGNLTYLYSLRFENNQITGSLPDLSKLTVLGQIIGNFNKLSGQVLSSYFGPTMTDFQIRSNQFTGPFPDITNWTNLSSLVIDNNQFTGPFPSIAIPSKIQYIRAWNNQFTSIPTSIINLPLAGAVGIGFDNNKINSITNLQADYSSNNIHPASTLILNLSSNQLDFSQLEILVDLGIPTFTYKPQSNISDITSINQPIGIPMVITARPTGQFSTVTWEKQGAGNVWATVTNDQDAQAQTYTRTISAPADAGVYRWKMTNTKVTGITLYSDPITVTVNAEGAVPDALEFQVLKNIYDSLGGSGWTNKTNWPTAGSWPASATAAQMGTWYGITISNGDIVKVVLNNNNLIGITPKSIAQLVKVYAVELNGNKIVGDIPDLSSLTGLSSFNIGGNSQLTPGPIPTWLQKLNNLWYLNLGLTNRTGAIPDFLWTKTTLTRIYFYSNQLTGPLPESIGNLTILKELYLYSNPLGGVIPVSLSNCSQLTHILLNDAKLTGTIPTGIGSLQSLAVLDLNANKLSGPIPTEIGSLVNLTSLYLYSNQLTGEIPSSLGNLTKLQYLYLYNNQLSGTIPSSLGSLSKLLVLYLHSNQLSGELPAALGSLSNLDNLNVASNKLTGSLPSSFGDLIKLRTLNINDNQFSGTLPSSFSTMTSLVSFYANFNKLEGELPSFIGNWTKLATLALQDNSFTGPFPSSIGSCTALSVLNGVNNKFTNLPSSLLNLPVTTSIDFTGSELISIPNFANHVNKTNLALYLQNNRLDFSQLELLPATGIKTLGSLIQKPINDIQKIDLLRNQPLIITARPTGQFSTVTWEKQNTNGTWSTLSNDQDSNPQTYTRTSAAIADEGIYRWKMTNTKVTGVTLMSDPITVKIPSLSIASASITPLSIKANDGAIQIAVNGGEPPYTYNWSSGEQTATLANKTLGAYTITATDAVNQTVSNTYHLGYKVQWTSPIGATDSNGALTKTLADNWGNAGANSNNVLQPGIDGWVEFILTASASDYVIGLSTVSNGLAQSDIKYGMYVSSQNGNKLYANDGTPSTAVLSDWKAGDVIYLSREGGIIKYYLNGTEIHHVLTTPSEALIAKASLYHGSSPQVITSFLSEKDQITQLINNYPPAGLKIPEALKITREGKKVKQPMEQQFMLSNLSEGNTKNVFPAPPCLDGNYYAGFQLYYDLGDEQTTREWLSRVEVTLKHGAQTLWTRPLQLNMRDQTFIATVFHDTPISCDGNYQFVISKKTNLGQAPEGNIYLKVILHKIDEEPFAVADQIDLTCTISGTKSALNWNHSMHGTIGYDVEWVFIDKYETHDAFVSQEDPFKFKEPARVTLTGNSFGSQLSNYLYFYPEGKVWHRIRAVGVNSENPEHRISGEWFYGCSAVDIQNQEPAKNWARQTVFAEDGKFKEVVRYFDGTVRERQTQTNLSTEEVTLVGETRYDYEGRPSVQILPVPATDPSLKYKSSFNQFVATDASVVANNTSTIRNKFHYDNYRIENSVLSDQSGAANYYSALNPYSNLTHKSYIPDAKGYAYSQTEYTNDGTGRVTRQSGVGETFRADGDHVTKSYYGTAAPAELIRLFGSNVGNASHYKKNAVVDANGQKTNPDDEAVGQVSITYTDQEGRTIATALAGDPPANVDALASYTSLNPAPVNVDLSNRNQKNNGVSNLTHTILNVTPKTVYTFHYDLSALASEVEEFGCQSCSFNLKISVTDPDGKVINLSSATGNENTDGTGYERKNITSASCTNALTINDIDFTVTFAAVGDYSVTKTLTSNEQTFDQIRTQLLQQASVQQEIQQLQQTYTIDPADCAICTACPEAEQAINDAIDEIAELDCENLYQQIVADLKEAHADNADYEPDDSAIKAHPKYCQYELCMKDKDSDVFEKQIARVTDWTTAVSKNYTNLVDVDPFFNVATLSGSAYKTAMQARLNNVSVGMVGTVDFKGTINEVTDPSNVNFYIDANGNQSGSGKHILYYDLMGRRIAMGESAYQTELDEQRWAFYRNFYLEAKRKTKINDVADYKNCAALKATLEAPDAIPTTETELKAWSDENGATGPVSQQQVDGSLFSLQLACAATISDAHKATISSHLETYLNSNPKNFFHLILSPDLGVNSDLVAIENILTTYGCTLNSVAVADPLTCAQSVTVEVPKVESPSPTENTLMANPNSDQGFSSKASITDNDLINTLTEEESLIGKTDSLETFNLFEAKMAIERESFQNNSISSNFRMAVMNNLVATNIPPLNEYNALVDLYNSTNGAHWENTLNGNKPWNPVPNTPQDVSNWYGITLYNGHVTQLHLENNSLIGIIPASINNLGLLEGLWLGGGSLRENNITGTISLDGLENLKILDLSLLDISEITGLPSHLTSLNLSWNHSIFVSSEGKLPLSFAQLEFLTSLDLSGCGIKELPTDFGKKFDKLTWLALRNNSITTLTNSLTGSLGYFRGVDGSLSDVTEQNAMMSLQMLDISSNTLTSLPDDFGKNWTSLQKLYLQGNKIQTLPDYFRGSDLSGYGLLNLQELYFSILVNNSYVSDHNLLTSLPPNFGDEWTSLKSLHLSGNPLLESLPDSFGDMTNLSTLELTDNPKLVSLPPAFVNLINLGSTEYFSIPGSLRLERNGLLHLPVNFGADLTKVKILFLNDNDLIDLPNFHFTEMTNLTSLDLRNNKLSTLPDNFAALPALKNLNLDNNPISSLPDSFGSGLSSLESLTIATNDPNDPIKRNTLLTTLPSTFGQGWPNLVSLDLHNNALTSLPAVFGTSWPYLRNLRLSYNELKTLPGAFGAAWTSQPYNGFRYGLALYLDNNLLETLPIDMGSRMAKLSTLYLNVNKLQSLPDNFGQAWSEVTTIDLSDNLPLIALPDHIGERMNSLRTFTMNNTNYLKGSNYASSMASLSATFGRDWNALTTLSMYGHRSLTTLSDTFKDKMAKLQSLDLHSCGLLSLPDAFGTNSTDLTSLRLDDNDINGLPSTFGDGLIKLNSLYLDGNKLTALSDVSSFQKMTSLQTLRLHDNITLAIPSLDIFSTFTKLSTLNLSNNAIAGSIPPSLVALPLLTTLDIHDNNISGPIPHKTSPNYRIFTVYNNKFTFSDLLAVKDEYPGGYSNFQYAPQKPIDQIKTINAKANESLTLTTTIDRNTTPASVYSWYKKVNNTVTLLTSTPSVNYHTYTLPNPIKESDEGTQYYYMITNPAALNLSLSSNKQTLHVSSPRIETICQEYDPNNPTLKTFSYEINWADEVQKCMDRAAEERTDLIEYAKEKLIEEKISTYYNSYSTSCFEKVTEHLNYTFISKEYHYTLYYYDQAGNLVQTVPPQGVNLITPAQHTLITNYKYNSLNQLTSQSTPDAGESTFLYNDKGQLRLSQNAQQSIDNKHSYTKYDEQGRITEVGEVNGQWSMTDAVLKDSINTLPFPAANTYSLSDLTRTHYDFADSKIQQQFPQDHLRTRVAWVEVIDKNATDTVKTHYTYDIHGNVKALQQSLPGLTPKRTDYAYDLVSGKVNYVLYQHGQHDQFIHQYTYDADNRITNVYTSTDGYLWSKEANYKYYLHGPLARTELGQYRVQGLDYYYTLQGWIKGVNMPYAGDPGADGLSVKKTGKDVFAYTLGYYNGDYTPINSVTLSDSRDQLWNRAQENLQHTGLYNGNISWMITDLSKIGEKNNDRKKGMQAMLYRYDQLHRITKGRSLTNYNDASGFAARNASAAYDENYTYDANGNILTLKRNDDNTELATLKDDFVYDYYTGTNKLKNVKTTQTQNYTYDAIGNLISDAGEGVTITWTPYGKVRSVQKGDSITTTYRYDASGNRVEKSVAVNLASGGDQGGVKITRYLRDASGNVMTIYNDTTLTEQPIYGSSRIGLYKGGVGEGARTLGQRNYELSNHLGNVLAVITDNVAMNSGNITATVVNSSDYYPFGLEMKGRSFSDTVAYRYGFNGKEKNKLSEGENWYSFEFREYDPRIGRFNSIDPIANHYPFQSPYVFAGNSPIAFIDILGMGPGDPQEHKVVKGDNLTKISKKYGVSVNDLAKMNKLSNPDKLKIGQVLQVNPEANFSEDPWDIKYINSSKEDGVETEVDDISDVGTKFITGLTYENSVIIGGKALKSVQEWNEVDNRVEGALKEITGDGKWSPGDVATRSFSAGSLPSNIKKGMWEALVSYVKGEDPWKNNSQNTPIHVLGSFTLSVRVNANGTTATVCVYDSKTTRSFSDNKAGSSANRARENAMITSMMTTTYQRYLWNITIK